MLTPTLRLILYAFAGLALIAGLMLTLGATDTEDWFSWTILPPLTAAALGAFYWASFVLLLSAARASTWAAARTVVLPVTVIAVVLLVITLVHLDRFHTDRLFGIFWVAAYVVVPPLLAIAIAQQLRVPGEDAHSGRRLPPPLRAALAAEGVVMIAASAVLLLAPDTAADLWPWALTPLTSRVIGAFALGIGLVAALVVRDDDIGPLAGPALAYTVLGALQLLAVAMHESDLGDDDLATGIYLAFLVAVLATGAYGSIAARASSRS
jgi:hypothetical protein